MTSRFRSPLAALVLSGLALIVAGTGANAQAPAADKPLKIGVSAGPYGDILREAAKLSAEQGVKAEIIEFTDWNQPNAALQAGDIDLNNFQNRPYLANQVKTRGYTIVALDESILVPAGLYSKSYSKIADIPDGAKIAIPNDPTNGGRGLALLQRAGLLKLKDGVGFKATPADVVDNPKHFQFKEIEAAQLPRSLGDVDAAVITMNYVMSAGLNVKEQGIFLEPKDEPLAVMVLAVRAQDKDNPTYKKIAEIFHSDAVKKFIADKYNGTIEPAE